MTSANFHGNSLRIFILMMTSPIVDCVREIPLKVDRNIYPMEIDDVSCLFFSFLTIRLGTSKDSPSQQCIIIILYTMNSSRKRIIVEKV